MGRKNRGPPAPLPVSHWMPSWSEAAMLPLTWPQTTPAVHGSSRFLPHSHQAFFLSASLPGTPQYKSGLFPPSPSALCCSEHSSRGCEDRTRLKNGSSRSGRKFTRAKASSMLHRCGRVMLWALSRTCWAVQGGQKGRMRGARWYADLALPQKPCAPSPKGVIYTGQWAEG